MKYKQLLPLFLIINITLLRFESCILYSFNKFICVARNKERKEMALSCEYTNNWIKVKKFICKYLEYNNRIQLFLNIY